LGGFLVQCGGSSLASRGVSRPGSVALGPLGGGCLLAGVAERGGLGGGGLGGLLGGAGGLQRLGERVCLGGGLGGLSGGGAVGDLARALVFGMTTGLGLFGAAGIVRRRGQEA